MTEEIRRDDWVNTFSSMGSIKDKSTGVQFLRAQRLPRRTLEALYEQHAMLYIASILYLQFENYRKTAQTKEGQQQQLRTILENTRKQLDLLDILGLDKNDKVGSVTHTLTGVHELIDRQRDYAAMCADILPKEIIFNESPAGLNTGELSRYLI